LFWTSNGRLQGSPSTDNTKFWLGYRSSVEPILDPSGDMKILVVWLILRFGGSSSWGSFSWSYLTLSLVLSVTKAYSSKYYFKVSYFRSSLLSGVYYLLMSLFLIASNYSNVGTDPSVSYVNTLRSLIFSFYILSRLISTLGSLPSKSIRFMSSY